MRFKEKKASESIVKWDILGIRLIKLDGLYRTTDPLYIFRPIDNSMKIVLHNEDGDKIVFSRAEYIVMDYDNVISNLRDLKELREVEKEHFEWLSPSNTVISFIKLEKGKLIIECNSRERLAKTKKLIRNVLKYCKFVGNKFEDISEIIGNGRILHFLSEAPLNKKEEKIIRDSFHKQIIEWLDTKIPVLGGLTPREAAKSEKEREKLIDIIKDMENYHERRKLLGRIFYDIPWIWDELGLKEYLYLKQ